MRLCSYVVVRDYGFAPNPFHGFCTLATCKPEIRGGAHPGDWVVGVGSVSRQLGGRLVYAMQVAERLTFDQYWNDPRFLVKRPYLSGSLMRRYGDNIYHPGPNGWIQEDSHHSLAGGGLNEDNLRRDTSADSVLVANHFFYFGRECPAIPDEFDDIRKSRRGHKYDFSSQEVEAFLGWLHAHFKPGLNGLPADWA